MSELNSVQSKIKISPTEEIEVPLHLDMSSFVPSVVAQYATVQNMGENFLVSFYELDPPVIFNATPELLEELKQEGYAAECVSRITIPRSHFIEMAKVFTHIAREARPTESGEQNADAE